MVDQNLKSYRDPGDPNESGAGRDSARCSETIDMFAPLVRTSDRRYARDAADQIAPVLGRIQVEVVDAYRRHGPMSSKVAEALPEFSRYGRSTIQKRISELFLVGALRYVPGVDSAIYALDEDGLRNPRTVETQECPTCGHRSRAVTVRTTG